MTKIAAASFTTQDIDKPVGVDIGGYMASLMSVADDGTRTLVGAPSPVADNAQAVDFTITDPGNYTVQVARVDVTGTPIFAPGESDVFNVPAEKVSVPLVVRVTLTDPPVVSTVEVPDAVTVAVGDPAATT